MGKLATAEASITKTGSLESPAEVVILLDSSRQLNLENGMGIPKGTPFAGIDLLIV